MAIFMHAALPGVTAAQYDELNSALQELPGDTFAGCLAHVCAVGENGLDIYDLWESQAAMDAFGAKMMPVAERFGWGVTPAPPTVAEVYRYWIPDGS
ncbi:MULTISPECIES: hypothetical protein [Streptomyces]|uniref:ABM domain-containing protein n=1 Tax=Streptomyces tsukubensis (strain DSM 42081 / NBRC 108919 / NRRL 18488 / 9993) TaxID=1114943 RepID=I2MWN5_STRT9|nr:MULTISPECIES: hypothetical protein [Streptomyces]AZK93599.1 hypothetical protein B7R87_06715 [Streptomyces tsukubensis]EIF89182.1 hypothetical protein [Streptomyces tsukubensis NRRL18488]MYS62611.1 hypothetical protein [Streptomyces sp. SID5473]QKM70254.1 hypothetical protein STSU_027100 [Streptomyces tsukubensis NRRL18488]TAI45765.1 hypothetical protein EWI31_01065 [Streptomyces tsukubensis]